MRLRGEEREHLSIVTGALLARGIEDYSLRRTTGAHLIVTWKRNGKRETIMLSGRNGPTILRAIRAEIRRILADRQPCADRNNRATRIARMEIA